VRPHRGSPHNDVSPSTVRSSGVLLRRANGADAAALAGVDVRAWNHAYSDFLDERRLAERTTAVREARWLETLDGDEKETWVLEVAGRIAGYVSLRPAEGEKATGEIVALYVDPPAQGAGAGSRILAAAQEHLAEQGFTRAMLWVFEENGLARRFYESRGWRLAPGAAVNEACESWAPAVRYERDVA
jgi:ribosomal protein S18 acetylase RimI-like enzyme